MGFASGSALPSQLTGDSHTFVWGLLEFSTVLGRVHFSRAGSGSGQYWKSGVWRSDSRLVWGTPILIGGSARARRSNPPFAARQGLRAGADAAHAQQVAARRSGGTAVVGGCWCR